MKNDPIPFQTTDWSSVPETMHPGESGTAWWKTIQLGKLRIRQVRYSENYKADHWCEKGHIVYCLEGFLRSELSDGRMFELSPHMSYQVSDNLSSHRSITEKGALLLIVDGSFLGEG
ncbi:MAG TPA: DHCW motif cupin fold protein [Bacteroidia bacterium]|nr:DHCW motif cupin fold protein [Bacteroidia bacterium]